MTAEDRRFMKKALRLAQRGLGRVHPNPLVGAVLVKNGKVVGSGAHEYFGGPHAEVSAIRQAKDGVRGARLYVTLEPCGHTGKTPPCTELLLKSGIKELVIGARDPNPKVNGRGISLLKKSGIKVRKGVLEEKARSLNKSYNHWIEKKMPYVTVKFAQSLDGKIHDFKGCSRWISGETSRSLAHRLRAEADAIVVGIRTILKDDPLLSVRLKKWKGRPPLKVVVDSKLKTPSRAKIFSKKSPGPVLIASTKFASRAAFRCLQKKAEIIKFPARVGRVDLKSLFRELGRRGVTSVLVEGGAELIAEVLSRKLAQEIYCFVAPKVLGNLPLSRAPKLRRARVRKIGEDFLIQGSF